MKKAILGLGVAVLAVAGAAVWMARTDPVIGEAYVRGRNVTVWNRVAQVREPVATLSFGDRVAILEQRGDNTRIRTAAGEEGWVRAAVLVSAELWERGAELLAESRPMPVQGRGRTGVTSNIRLAPGRDAPRLYQFPRGVPVEVLRRATAEVPGEAEPRREGWFFIRASTEESGEIAGWTVARFIELDVPDMIRSLAAGFRLLGALELHGVAEGEATRPYYLILAATGAEGQACDFTMVRVYTWSPGHRRYETAYAESNLCGSMPVLVTREGPAVSSFRFRNAAPRGEEERVYTMRQTVVRRVRR